MEPNAMTYVDLVLPVLHLEYGVMRLIDYVKISTLAKMYLSLCSYEFWSLFYT